LSLLHSGGSFDQIDIEHHLDVTAWSRAAPRSSPAPTTAGAEEAPEEVVEEVVEGAAGVTPTTSSAGEASVPVTVVNLTLTRIAENLVGLGYFLEPNLGLRIPDVPVRVVLHGQLAISLGDLHLSGSPNDPENLVIIPFGHERGSRRQ
jgi:hypothetical protein